MTFMHAIRFDHFGPPTVLHYQQVDRPKQSAEQLLIKVIAAAVNPIDLKIRDGSSFVAQHLTLPSGLGFDVCGEVIECGHNASGFRTGDIVMGSVGRHNNPSAYAEYCTPNADQVIRKPDALDPLTAGALPIAALTAWQALHRHAHIQAGQTVLVHAAAGGVGHLCVQYAKLAGCQVIATASARHHDFLTSLGVEEIIDYRQQDFTKACNNVDAVIDLVGSDAGIRSISVLKQNGILVTIPTVTRDKVLAAADGKSIKATGMLAETNMEDLQIVADLCASGQVTLKIAKCFALQDATKAHELLAEGHTQGKVVLAP